jgi:hypothetical protein
VAKKPYRPVGFRKGAQAKRLQIESIERRSRERRLAQLASIEAKRRTAEQTRQLARVRDISRSAKRTEKYQGRRLSQAPLLDMLHTFLVERNIHGNNKKPGRPRNHTVKEFEDLAHEKPELTRAVLTANFDAHRLYKEGRSAASAYTRLDDYDEINDNFWEEWPEFGFYH